MYYDQARHENSKRAQHEKLKPVKKSTWSDAIAKVFTVTDFYGRSLNAIQ